MPRLTNAAYLAQRYRLMSAWERDAKFFGELEIYEQHALHDFFAPSRELYDDDALTFRREMTKRYPSLPHRAGRAYAHFERVVEAYLARRLRRPGRPTRVPARKYARQPKHLRIETVINPNPNVHRIARMLVEFAIEDQKRGKK